MSVPHETAHAEAAITVLSSEREVVDRGAGPELAEIRIRETFAGDWAGESAVRALEVRRDGRSAQMVSLQRFCGRLGGRSGSFVLQGSERIEGDRITAAWSVAPGSGTGELVGLRGEGGFEGRFGEGSRGTLDYWFEDPPAA